MGPFRPLWEQPYALTTLATGLLATLLALVTIWKSPRAPAARCWGIMCACVAGWAFVNVLSILAVRPAASLAYLRAADAVALFVPVTFLHFSMQFTQRHRPVVLRAAYAATTAVFLTVWTPWFIGSEGQWKFDMWFEQGGPGFVAFMTLFVTLPAYGIRLLLQAAKAETGARRAQRLCLALATGLGFSGGFMWFLPAIGLDIPPIGGHWIALYGLVAMYAIVRYEFLNIRVIIRRSVVYSALVTLLTVTYATLTYIGQRYFQSALGHQSLALSVATFAAIALAFQPLQRRLQRWADRWLLPEPTEALARRLEQLEREVRDAEKHKAVSRLAAGIAHEIKNPLTALKTFLEVLPERAADPQFLAQFQRVAGQEVSRLQSLAHGLLDFAKPRPAQREPVDLRAVLDQVAALTKPDLLEKGVTLDLHCQHNGATFLGDPGQLSQAFLNLILNARDAMPKGGTLTVTTRAVGGALEVVLTDTGQGIADADLPHLFEPFFTRKPTGTGLGLSIVQQILQDHGGTIAVASTPGRGTTFTVRLPIAEMSRDAS